MSSFIVKVCGITCEEDARVAVEAGANALGFNFYTKSPRYVEPERAAQITERVTGDYLKVGVFVVERAFSLPRWLSSERLLDVLQLHGHMNGFSAPPDYRIWRAITAGSELPPENAFEALLLDSFTHHYGGSGKSFDWTLAKQVPHRILIAGGLDASNVAEAVRIARPWGVDACSRLESKPGKKDPTRVREFVRAALAALQVSEEIAL
jgi:phosphoribosylanthranilate isomerase